MEGRKKGGRDEEKEGKKEDSEISFRTSGLLKLTGILIPQASVT